MKLNFKEIHIGELIHTHVKENVLDMRRICNFMDCNEQEIEEMYKQADLPTNILLKWSKLLEYDFFRIYSQHLTLYAPPKSSDKGKVTTKSSLPVFRKSLYTKEIISFILELHDSGKKTKKEIIEEYNIPKTTLYKWLAKY